jgi:ribosomal protein S12 methylthiotransferase accessory factor
MKVSNLSDNNVKISLAPNMSQFTVDSGFLFVKKDNRLFKMSTAADIAELSRVFDILKQRKKLVEITNLLSDFKKKDVIDLLRSLYNLNLIQIEEQVTSGQKGTDRGLSNKGAPYIKKDTHLLDSKVLLIGEGVLASKLVEHSKVMGLRLETISSSAIIRSSHKILMNVNDVNKSQSRLNGTILPSNSLFSSTSFLNEYDLIIAAQDYSNIIFFETINKICINKSKPWLRASFDDNMGYLGPLVIPGETSCYNCCELRLVTNSPHYEYILWRYKERIPQAKLSVPRPFVENLAAICVNDVITFLTNNYKPQTIDNLLSLDTRQMHLSRHRVIPYPNCPHCDLLGIRKQEQQMIIPKPNQQNRSNKKSVGSTASTFPDLRSSLSGNELLQELKEIEDEKTGIVMKSEKLFDPNILGIRFHHFFNVTCSNPLRMKLTEQPSEPMAPSILLSTDNLIEPSPSGSGYTATEAEIGALMESVERYSSRVVDQSRIMWSSYNRVQDRAINPLNLVLYTDKQYERVDFKCSRYSADTEIPWIEGMDLSSGRRVLVPADFVYYPPFRERPLVLETSNGAAAHTDMVQAVLNGIYEVIERDTFLIMWLNKLSMPILDVRKLPFGFDESVKLMREFDMAVKLVHLVNDTHIPTVMAVCYNKAIDKYPAMVVGTASNIEPEVALKKALFEMEFQLIIYLQNPPEQKIIHPNQISASYEHPMFYLNPENRKYWDFMIRSTRRSELPTLSRRSTKNKFSVLVRIVKLLSKQNHRVIYVDITPPDIRKLGLSVVKVLITDFQPLYFRNNARLSFQRLHTVPASLGYNKNAAMQQKELHSAPHPLP